MLHRTWSCVALGWLVLLGANQRVSAITVTADDIINAATGVSGDQSTTSISVAVTGGNVGFSSVLPSGSPGSIFGSLSADVTQASVGVVNGSVGGLDESLLLDFGSLQGASVQSFTIAFMGKSDVAFVLGGFSSDPGISISGFTSGGSPPDAAIVLTPAYDAGTGEVTVSYDQNQSGFYRSVSLAFANTVTLGQIELTGPLASAGAGGVGFVDVGFTPSGNLPGDADADGDVDLDDLNNEILANLYTAVPVFQNGDVTGDSFVDLTDFRRWKDNFPSPSNSNTVPEPSSFLLAICVLAVFLTCAPRNRKILQDFSGTQGCNARLSWITATLLVAAAFLWASDATAQNNVNWVGATGNWTDISNWDVPNTPEAEFGERGVINNGGTAVINTVIAPGDGPGGLSLGLDAGTSGSLLVQSGGSLPVETGVSLFGVMVVGDDALGMATIEGTGEVTVQSITVRGDAGSTLTLTDSASLTAANNITLDRNTRVVGPNVTFSAASNLTLGATGTYTAEITAATHSTIFASNNAIVAGTLNVEFNGVAPALGNTWNLVDAGTTNGNFTEVNLVGSSLPVGQYLRTSTDAGGVNGSLTQLGVVQLLQIDVNRDSGAVTIANPGATNIDITGYTVQSANGALDGTNSEWSSLEDQAVGDWTETNAASIRIAEVSALGSLSLLGSGASDTSIGNPFVTAIPFGVDPEDLEFQYTTLGGDVVDGVVTYSGSTVNNLLLTVDPTTGEGQLSNPSSHTVSIDAYTISSDSGTSLDPAGWTPLGGDWLVGNSAADRLSEVQPLGLEVLSPGATLDLGDLFAIGEDQDLTFEFLLDGELLTNTGAVVYGSISAGLVGDYNSNGIVDAADYTVWRDTESTNVAPGSGADGDGDGVIGPGDYTVWVNNFGSTTSTSTSTSTAVPEPGALATAALAMLLGSFTRRSRKAINR